MMGDFPDSPESPEASSGGECLSLRGSACLHEPDNYRRTRVGNFTNSVACGVDRRRGVGAAVHGHVISSGCRVDEQLQRCGGSVTR